MNLEGGNKPEQKGILRSIAKLPGVKESALTLSLLGADPLLESVHGDKAYAAEIMPSDSWEQGAQKLHTLQHEKTNEVFKFFISTKGGEKYAWGDTLQGTSTGSKLTQEGMKDAQHKIAELTAAGEKNVDVCAIHTHPSESIARVVNDMWTRNTKFKPGYTQYVDLHMDLLGPLASTPSSFNKENILMMPPSYTDAEVLNNKKGFFGRAKPSGVAEYIAVPGVQIHERNAVFDGPGVWYYETFTSPEERQAFVQTLDKDVTKAAKEIFAGGGASDMAARAWMVYANSYNYSDIDTAVNSPAFKALQYAYAYQFQGIKLQFVPMQDIANRLPCSPELKKLN